nr:MAG TPA: hypothetical protein [Herelleviridae sp.]
MKYRQMKEQDLFKFAHIKIQNRYTMDFSQGN